MEQKNQTVVELQVQKLKDMWNALSQTSKTLTINGGIGIVIVAVLAMTGVLNQGSLYGDILGGANSINDFDADTCGNSGLMCGVNDRTYSNACDLEEAGIKLRHAGICQLPNISVGGFGYASMSPINKRLWNGYGYSACRKVVFERIRKIGFKRTIAIRAAHQMCYEKGLGFGYGYGGNSPKRGLCSRKYQPVCGVNDVTYGNACLASQQNGVVVKSQGVCPVVPSSLPNLENTLDDLLDNGNQTLRAWQIDIDNAYPRATKVGTKNFLLGKAFVEFQGNKTITAVLLKIVSPDNSNPFLNLRMKYKNQEIGSEATFFSPGIVLVRFKDSFKLTPGDNTLSFYADIGDKKMENIHIYLDRIEMNNVHFNPPLNSFKLSTVYIRSESLSSILNGLLNTGKQQPPVLVPVSTGNDLGQILSGLLNPIDLVISQPTDLIDNKTVFAGQQDVELFRATATLTTGVVLGDLKIIFDTALSQDVLNYFQTFKLLIGDKIVSSFSPVNATDKIIFQGTYAIASSTQIKILGTIRSNIKVSARFRISNIDASSFGVKKYLSSDSAMSSFVGSVQGITLDINPTTVTVEKALSGQIIVTSPVVVSPIGINNGFNRTTTAYKFQITPKDSTKQYQLKSVQMSCTPNTNEVYVMNGDINAFNDSSNQLSNSTKLSEILMVKDLQKSLATFSSPKIFTIVLAQPMSAGEASCGIKEITIVDLPNGKEFVLSTYPDSGFINLPTSTLR